VLDKLTVNDFAGHLEAAFPTTPPGDEPVEMRLIEAKTLGPPTEFGAKRAPFSIIFIGPERPMLAQRIHTIVHPELGPLEIFIVPIGPAPGRAGLRYQAIFA
jgi:hypothetical protein